MIRRLRRRLFRAVIRTFAHGVHHVPRITLRIADAIAPAVFAPMSLEKLRAIFPRLTPELARSVITRARQQMFRDIIMAEHTRVYDYQKGGDRLYAINKDIVTLPHPMILGTFHLGALAGIGASLHGLPKRVLVVRATPRHSKPHPNVEVEVTRVGEQQRARIFHRAIQFLQEGNYVFLPLDPEESTRIDAPFQGRMLPLARGPFALARITRAPILPMIARWNGARVEVVLGDPIPASDDESATAAAAALWLERYLDEHPLDISERVLALTNEG
jgi:lauroyl/myristoyl acyltransferase